MTHEMARWLDGWMAGHYCASHPATYCQRRRDRHLMRNLLITGGAGFIGSNFTRYDDWRSTPT